MKLVYLIFASNNAYVSVVKKAPEGVVVDFATKTWKSPLIGGGQSKRIGQHRYVESNCGRSGIIGVYDLDIIEQVSSMVGDALETIRGHSSAD